MPTAALFDLDRTLVRKETASLYVRYQREIGEATIVDLARAMFWVAEYTLGVIDIEDVAARAVRSHAGMHEDTMVARCDEWFHRYVEQHVTEAGRQAVAHHKAKGDVIAIVTGGTVYAARPLARLLGIEHVVASRLEKDERGYFTGRPQKPLCYGAGKIELTERLASELGFDVRDATFYSDSYTDLPLLEHVRVPVVVNPDTRLRRVARRRGWRVERW